MKEISRTKLVPDITIDLCSFKKLLCFLSALVISIDMPQQPFTTFLFFLILKSEGMDRELQRSSSRFSRLYNVYS